ncbi:MAG: hypothetical protein AB7Q29_12805 [Vicinamibacterales bacterium]
MRVSFRWGVAGGMLLALAACETAEVPPTMIVETGCVTAHEGRFVLTDLQPAGTRDVEPGGSAAVVAARPTTEAYVLVGAEQDLRQHVGEEVRVTGEAVPDHVVNLENLHPMVHPRATATSGTSASDAHAADGARIATGYQLRMEVSEMNVQAVQPTGQACQSSGDASQ